MEIKAKYRTRKERLEKEIGELRKQLKLKRKRALTREQRANEHWDEVQHLEQALAEKVRALKDKEEDEGDCPAKKLMEKVRNGEAAIVPLAGPGDRDDLKEQVEEMIEDLTIVLLGLS